MILTPQPCFAAGIRRKSHGATILSRGRGFDGLLPSPMQAPLVRQNPAVAVVAVGVLAILAVVLAMRLA